VTIDQFVANPRRVSDGFDPIPNLDPAVVANNPVGNMLAVDPRFRSGYAEQFNMQVQQALPKDMVFKIGYVGNLGRRLDNVFNPNQALPGPGAVAPRRPLFALAPGVVNVDFNVSDGLSAYHSLQSTLERRFANGVGFLAAYTWSHSVDTVANQFGGGDNGPLPQDPRYRRNDRGNSGFDLRHRFVYSMNYELPFGKGRKFAAGNNLVNQIVGGWDTNMIFVKQSGQPFTPTLNTAVSNAGGSRPDRLKSGTLDNPTIAKWFDTSFNTSGAAWATPAQFTYGNGGRNILYGPGRTNVDFSLFKNVTFREHWKVQFRTEVFNIFNHTQFDTPNGAIGGASAGIIAGIVGTPRQVQFALRLAF
jgi:hypothetical protein